MRVELQKQGWTGKTVDSIISQVLGTGVKRQQESRTEWLPLSEYKETGEKEGLGKELGGQSDVFMGQTTME